MDKPFHFLIQHYFPEKYKGGRLAQKELQNCWDEMDVDQLKEFLGVCIENTLRPSKRQQHPFTHRDAETFWLNVFQPIAFRPWLAEGLKTFIEDNQHQPLDEGRQLSLLAATTRSFYDNTIDLEARNHLRDVVHHLLEHPPQGSSSTFYAPILSGYIRYLPYDVDRPVCQEAIINTIEYVSDNLQRTEQVENVFYFFSWMVQEHSAIDEQEYPIDQRPWQQFHNHIVDEVSEGVFGRWMIYQWAETVNLWYKHLQPERQHSSENLVLQRLTHLLSRMPMSAVRGFFDLQTQDLVEIFPRLAEKKKSFDELLIELKSLTFDLLQDKQMDVYQHPSLNSHPVAINLRMRQDMMDHFVSDGALQPRPRVL